MSKSQISTHESPYSWDKGMYETVKKTTITVTLPNLDFEAIYKEDLENEGSDTPVRFGFSHGVNLSLSNSGTWHNTTDGGRLWTLEIFSPDALSLNLLYDKFWLPEGSKFFIYSADKEQYIGAFTSHNNKGGKESIMGFATGFLFTNSIILEYYEPEGVTDKGVISIAQVISGYRYIYDIIENENQSRHNVTNLACHNDINCTAGNSFQEEKNAICYMVMGGSFCSGALLNTTANDNRLTFLTANHCYSDNVQVSQYVFYWNYEAPACGGVANIDSRRSTTGSTLLARRADSDFMLLQLLESPISNPYVVPYFLGWDRSSSAATSGAGIHHPNGAQKKISLSTSISNYSSSINWTDGTTSPANTHWKVDFLSGSIEGGSSGSPFLNQSKRVVGQLHGGDMKCPPNAIEYYGRFDVSWSGNSSTERLKDWLDPTNSNVQSINGKAILIITGSNLICYGSPQTFSVSNAPSGFTWDKSANLNLTSSSSNTATFSATSSSVSAMGWVSINYGGLELARLNVWVGGPSIDITGSTSVPAIPPGQGGGFSYTATSSNYTGPSITSYEWSLSPVAQGAVYNYGYWANVYFYPDGYYQVSARACNTCGYGQWAYISVNAGSRSPSSVYPNPVSDILNIDVGADASVRGVNLYDIRLYDIFGSQLRQTSTNGGTVAQISVSNLPNGIYYLHVLDGVSSTPEIHKIIVNH